MMFERCRCDGTDLLGSDHCPSCYCEQFEERCRYTVHETATGDTRVFADRVLRFVFANPDEAYALAAHLNQ